LTGDYGSQDVSQAKIWLLLTGEYGSLTSGLLL
jgi:hypothetical protein